MKTRKEIEISLKEEYKRKYMSKAIFWGILWMLPFTIIEDKLSKDWLVIPMVLGFVGIVFHYFIIKPRIQNRV